MFLFGLTWLFAILTVSVPGLRETFQILFTVFNSFQGFFIFLFLCVFNKDAQESWKATLVCGKLSRLFHFSNTQSSGNLKPRDKTKSKGNKNSGTNPVVLESSLQVQSHTCESETLRSSSGHKTDTLVIVNTVLSKFDNNHSNKIDVDESFFTVSVSDQIVPVSIDENGKDIEDNELPLKIQVRRFSTKKEGTHHIEEMEVEIYSDSDSDSDN